MKKVALVTGGARGIGVGISRHLAEAGYDLVICGRRTEAEARDALDAFRSAGAEVLYCVCDVADAESRAAMMDAIRKRFGGLHVLVNNAGVAPRERKDPLDLSEADYEWLMKINLTGPCFLMQACAKFMLEQQAADSDYSGCIINIGSVSATMVSVMRGEYCISKAGLAMANAVYAMRLAEHDIPVYELRPGLTRSDMTEVVKEKYDDLVAEGFVPQRRWGEPEDSGRAVVSLARGDFAYSTGAVIMLDGGMTVQRL